MKHHVTKFVPMLATVLSLTAGSLLLNAQITNAIQAHVGHSFMVGSKTLQPGDYTFMIEGNSDLRIMKVQNAKGDNLAQFSVRESVAKERPKHSELIFKKYGDTEFLSKVYEGGSKIGVALAETSRDEMRMMKDQHAIEHAEEQQ